MGSLVGMMCIVLVLEYDDDVAPRLRVLCVACEFDCTGVFVCDFDVGLLVGFDLLCDGDELAYLLFGKCGLYGGVCGLHGC